MRTEAGVRRGAKVSPVLWYPQVATAGENSSPFERTLCGQRTGSVGLRRFPKFCTVAYCYDREGGYGGRKRENESPPHEKILCVQRTRFLGLRISSPVPYGCHMYEINAFDI